MLSAVLGLIGGPVAKIIDKAVPDRSLAERIKAELQKQALEQDSELVRAASAIITAEARGDSWLQRSWRPITMLSFLGLLWAYWLGLAPGYVVNNPDVVKEVFSMLQIGIGGYIAGRSGEKIARIWKEKE